MNALNVELGRNRLWPVLTLLVVLVAGAAGVDALARRRDPSALVITVSDAQRAAASIDDDADDDSLEASSAAATSPEHAEARRLARRGELDRALELFAKLVQEHADSAPLRADYGFWLLKAGKLDAALAELDAVARLEPNDPRVALVRGSIRRGLKDEAGAEAEFRRAITLKPSYAAARIKLGALLVHRGEATAARDVIEPATKSGDNDDRARALVLLGRAELGAGNRERAELCFQRAIERAPSQPELRIGIADAWLSSPKDEDRSRAAQALARAADLSPDVPAVRAAIGRSFERAGDSARAESEYERALEIDPSFTYARRRLLRLAMSRREYRRARVHVEYMLAHAPANPEHHFLAGLIAARDGKAEDARKHYEDALERAHGTYPEAWLNIGLLEKNAGRWDQAIEAYSKAIEQRPQYVAAFNNLALAYSAASRPDQAERALRKALEADAKYAPGWVNLGKLLSGMGRNDEAVAALVRATALRTDYAEARLNLGVAYARAERFQDAIAEYRGILASHPNYVNAWHNLGIALDSVGSADAARDAYQRALGIDADHVPTLRKLAEHEARRGRSDEARKAYEELLDHVPSDGDARLALGELALQAGDYAGCAHQLDLASTVAAPSTAIDKLRERCRREGQP